jgi:hypothetical protein
MAEERGVRLARSLYEHPWIIARGARAATWSRSIRRLARTPALPGAVVFVGGSSIALWKSLGDDLAPFPVVRAGFGGAHVSHCLAFADELVLRHAPSRVVMYAGENDVIAGKSVAAIVADVASLAARIRAPLLFLTTKVSPQCRARAEVFAALDAAVRAAGIDTLDVTTPLLDARGAPRREMFAWDGLHLSRRGYEAWATAVRPALTS